MAKKALTPAQLKKQMNDARKGIRKAADVIAKAFYNALLPKFGEGRGSCESFPDVKYDGECYVWDIDYDDEEQNEQVVWLEDAGLYPSDVAWLWL